MKRIVFYPSVIIFVTTLILLVLLQQVIPNILFSSLFNEPVVFSSFNSNWSLLYLGGCFLLPIYLTWKYASIMDKKIGDSVKVFSIKIHRNVILFFSILFLILPFNQMTIFSDISIRDFNIFTKSHNSYIKYADVSNVYVNVYFDQASSKGQDKCQVRAYLSFVSNNKRAESWIRPPFVYDIVNIIKQNNINTEISYTNNCKDHVQFNQEKIDIENALGVRFE